MGAQLRLLVSDGVTPLVSINFGNILSGAQGAPALLFMNSYGDAACAGSEFGVEATAGNDGYTFSEVAAAVEIDNSSTSLSGVVATTDGNIAAGADIAYKVTVMDQWGHETLVNPSALSPVFAAGATNKVTLSWGAVTGAFKYAIYSNISGGGYFKVGESTTASYVDLSGTNDSVTAPPAAGKAYKFTTWAAGPLNVGSIPAGGKVAVGVRENIPPSATAAGNPRQHKVFVSFVTV